MQAKPVVIATIGIAACPLMWNILGRNEYRNHTIQKVGGKKVGCYSLAAVISLSFVYRTYLFNIAVEANKALKLTNNANVQKVLSVIGFISSAGGMTLVFSSYYRLGITGTYLGDYFGILMKERITSFPYSHFSDPMYTGSVLNFLGTSLAQNSLVGVGLTAWLQLVYFLSVRYFEEPFTALIYSEKEKNQIRTS